MQVTNTMCKTWQVAGWDVGLQSCAHQRGGLAQTPQLPPPPPLQLCLGTGWTFQLHQCSLTSQGFCPSFPTV